MAIEDVIAQGPRPPQVDDPTTAYGRTLTLGNLMQQRQINQQQIQSGQVELQQHQRALDQSKALDEAYRNALTVTPEGTADIDTGKLTTALGQAGHGSAIPGVLKSVQEYKKASAELSKTQGEVGAQEADFAGSLGSTLRTAKYDPNLALTMLQHAVASKHVDGQLVAPLIGQVQQALQQDTTGEAARQVVQQISNHMIAGSPKQRELETAAQTAGARDLTANTGATKLTLETPGLQATGEQLQRTNNAAKLLTAKTPEDYQALLDGMPHGQAKLMPVFNPADPQATATELRRIGMTPEQQTMADLRAKEIDKLNTPAELATVASDPRRSPEDRQRANDALQRLNEYQKAGRPVVNNIGNSGVTDDDFQRAGEQYARTGAMPSLGQGSAQARMRIMHEANQFARARGLNPGDMVAMQAAYSGDKKSLEKFQAQRDQVASFESTAGKNIDLFLNLAKQIPDTGSPWINTPLRLLDQKLAGAPNMAAVNAARAVATNEIAKVTSGGSMSGVLSDAARQEVKEYSPQNATFAQTLAIVKVLKQDMANRHASMNDTLSDIKGRIGGGQAQQGTAGSATYQHTATGANGHKIGTNDGGKTWFDVQTGGKL
jgi:hypothetical protein